MTQTTAARTQLKTVFVRGIVAGALMLTAITSQTNYADAFSDEVRNACMSDYFAYCSAHDPESSKLRQCMRAAGSKLSAGCINALVSSGEVGKTKSTRRSANLR